MTRSRYWNEERPSPAAQQASVDAGEARRRRAARREFWSAVAVISAVVAITVVMVRNI